MEKFYKKYPKNEFGYDIGKLSTILSEILLSQTSSVTLSYDTLMIT